MKTKHWGILWPAEGSEPKGYFILARGRLARGREVLRTGETFSCMESGKRSVEQVITVPLLEAMSMFAVSMFGLQPPQAFPVVSIPWLGEGCPEQMVFAMYLLGMCGDVGGTPR